MFSSASTAFARCAVLLTLASGALAHSNMFFPKPRADQSYTFQDSNQNACENENTDIPPENVFRRGQTITPKWWWNNHNGGFVKIAITKNINGRVENKYFLNNENIISGQCYTGGCDMNGFDPGNTHTCVGKDFVIPTWVSNGDYVMQWSQIGGYNSDAIFTKQLPLYHTCANIRIEGEEPTDQRPADWIAPFVGGGQDSVRGQEGNDGICAFKGFNVEPANAAEVDVNKDVNVDNMQFGVPAGWAIAGATNEERVANLTKNRVRRSRIARNQRVE